MERAIILLLFFSHLSFAGDNTVNITYKGSGSSITSIQEGNSNTTTILCGANSSGTVPGSNYTAHTCTGAVWNVDVEGAHNAYVWNNNYADNNSANVIQSGSGNKDADIFFYADADNTDVDLTQSGNGAHTANMKFYTDDYDVDVTQSGSTNQAYSATFNCTSSCTKTISITQQ